MVENMFVSPFSDTAVANKWPMLPSSLVSGLFTTAGRFCHYRVTNGDEGAYA
jgi:hypothetical protein